MAGLFLLRKIAPGPAGRRHNASPARVKRFLHAYAQRVQLVMPAVGRRNVAVDLVILVVGLLCQADKIRVRRGAGRDFAHGLI